MKARKRLYLAKTHDGAFYQLRSQKASWGPHADNVDGVIEEFCANEFERTTGIKLLNGEIHPVEIKFKFLDRVVRRRS